MFGPGFSRITAVLFYSCAFVFIRGPIFSARAEIIDRIAVSVGERVITVTDIEREIRVNAFLNGAQPDLSRANRRVTADKMVEQKLIQRELETSRYPQAGPAEIEPVLADFKSEHFKDDDAYARSLAAYGITEQNVRAELLWQRNMLRFIEIRFRPGVQVTDEEVLKYFDGTVAPAARAAHPGEAPRLEDYRTQIEEKLTGDRADEEMNRWLELVRRRVQIVYHEEAFQ